MANEYRLQLDDLTTVLVYREFHYGVALKIRSTQAAQGWVNVHLTATQAKELAGALLGSAGQRGLQS